MADEGQIMRFKLDPNEYKLLFILVFGKHDNFETKNCYNFPTPILNYVPEEKMCREMEKVLIFKLDKIN